MAGYRVPKEPLDDSALVVVRGGLLELPKLRVAAIAAFHRFGEYGVSVYAAPTAGAIDDLARNQLQRHEWLTITTVGDIRRAGLEIIPTFRRPHCTVLLSDLDADLDRLLGCHTVVAINPHVVIDEDEQ